MAKRRRDNDGFAIADQKDHKQHGDDNPTMYKAFVWVLWDKGLDPQGNSRPNPPTETEFLTRHVELTEVLRSLGDYTVQLERCPTTKRLHYQGTFHLNRGGVKKRDATLLPFFQDKFYGFHLDIASTQGRYELQNYCQKSYSRVGGPWTDRDSKIFSPQEMIEMELHHPFRSFQNFLHDQMTSKVINDRKINVVHNPQGCCGKSWFAKHMCASGKAQTYASWINAVDLSYLLAHFPYAPCYIFDLPRTKPAAISSTDTFSLIESLKAGCFLSTKFKPTRVIRKSAHVWIFTNHLPPLRSFSPDRWVFWTLNQDGKNDPKLTQMTPAQAQVAAFDQRVQEKFEAMEERYLTAQVNEKAEIKFRLKYPNVKLQPLKKLVKHSD